MDIASDPPMPQGLSPALIVGLGNPDEAYYDTFHNAGILMLDFLASQTPQPEWRHRQGEHFLVLPVGEHKLLVKPQCYMNNSGKAVREALQRFSIPPHQLLVIHDDADIALGKWKFSYNRGSAGHKGVASIIDALGTAEFWRLRIGIRKRTAPQKAGAFVLDKIPARDKRVLYSTFSQLIEKCKGKKIFFEESR
ncbi:aminoacyl-tRNA hydrolase [Candidatus Parcubacteria bacterium]|nr:MAG: aminoacyl-tRNA hydrolase [Candidatus Parcubacteria bacterium]